MINRALKVVATADHEKPFQQALLPVRAGELTVSVIHCNDAPARKLLLGDRPRMRLLEGLDDIGLTLKHAYDIKDWEQRMAATQPWLQMAREDRR